MSLLEYFKEFQGILGKRERLERRKWVLKSFNES